MNAKLLLLTIIVAGAGCSPSQTEAEKQLLRVWFAPGVMPKESAAAVNRCFTSGTRISKIVGVLGPGYVRVTPYSMINLNGSPVMCWLEYTNQRVTIGTSARVGSGEDLLAATFTGAGYQLAVYPITNAPPLGQPDGAANRSQPVRPETNRTSVAAGSGR
jgi:hypothetical protein